MYFHNYKIKCSIGKRGLTKKKVEGDGCTPNGKFNFEYLLYRKDKIKKVDTNLRKRPINRSMGWCDDPNSNKYNKLVNFPFSGGAEKLYLKSSNYNLILIIKYNRNPVVKNKGSAIFLHLTNKKYRPTLGCIAIKKKDFLKILPLINKKTKICIN